MSDFRPRLDHSYEKYIEVMRNLSENELDALFFGDVDEELLDQNVKLAKKNQRYQDLNRVERKAFREHARIENAVTALHEEYIRLLKKEGLGIKTKKHVTVKDKRLPVIVAQLSDLHANTLVDTHYNKFDFYVLSKRLKKYADKLKEVGKNTGSKKLVIAMLGDISTSNRRLDEILNFCTNIAKGNLVTTKLLKEFIIDLNEWFDITVAGVTGNESRTHKDLGWSDIVATDNHDMTIYGSLDELFSEKEGITFTGMGANEYVIKIHGQNFLLIHGHQMRAAKTQKSVQEIIGKYSRNEGIHIHYCISGHIHSSIISDHFSRNASMIGGDQYGTEGLNFASRAAQNIHEVYEKDIHSMRIDLQNTDNITGYDLEDHLNKYAVKSANQDYEKRTILEIVI